MTPEIYEFGEFRLDVGGRRLSKESGETIALTPRIFDLLHFLVEKRGETIARDELLDKVWGADTFVEEANLTQSVFVLRRALGENKKAARFIVTVPQKGYRFIAAVREISGAENEETPPAPVAAPKKRGLKVASRPVLIALLLVAAGVFLTSFWWRQTVAPSSFAKNYPLNIRAFLLYLEGRRAWGERNKEGFQRSIILYGEALELDPNYAPAYAGIADSFLMLGDYAYLSPQESAPPAKENAQRALAIDPQLAEAHASLAYATFLYDWDWTGAEESFKKAIELKAGNSTAHQWYAEFLASRRRFEEAEREIAVAERLEPSRAVKAVSGWLLYLKGDADGAIASLRRTTALEPDFYFAHFFLALALSAKGEDVEALREFKLAVDLSDGNSEVLAYLGRAYGLAGNHAEARRILEKLKTKGRESYVSPFFFALVYEGLNEREQMFVWFEKSIEERARVVPLYTVEPHLEPLRHDPRFIELLSRIS